MKLFTDEILSDLAEFKPMRADGKAIPINAPRGWVHMAFAAARIWQAAYGETKQDWHQYVFAMMQLSALAISGDKTNPQFAVARRFAGEFTGLCAQNTLRTGYRPIGGASPIVPLSPDWWTHDDPLQPFRSWGFDPANPSSGAVNAPCWLWVRQEELERHANHIENRRWNMDVMAVSGPDDAGAPAAVELLRKYIPPEFDPLALLVDWARRGGVKTWCARGNRFWDGKLCEIIDVFQISPEVWRGVDPYDVKTDLPNGTFYASLGRESYLLDAVYFKVDDLSRCWRNTFEVPEVAAPGKAEPLPASPPTDEEILARCDELWLAKVNVRQLDVLIPKEPRFKGVKSDTIRTLTNGRYKAPGRGPRTPDMIRR